MYQHLKRYSSHATIINIRCLMHHHIAARAWSAANRLRLASKLIHVQSVLFVSWNLTQVTAVALCPCAATDATKAGMLAEDSTLSVC